MKNVFDPADVTDFIGRINQLDTQTKALWGKMTPAQMLAHCNVTYELVYTSKHPKPNFILKFILKMFVKQTVVSEKPYPQNGQTASYFVINDQKDFEAEKIRLINHINKTHDLGASHFEGKESHSFGPLTTTEWNNLFSKHLDHHLRQFGV